VILWASATFVVKKLIFLIGAHTVISLTAMNTTFLKPIPVVNYPRGTGLIIKKSMTLD